MAGTTREIKRRIKGITSTKQITKAMELVSSAKLKRTRERLEKTRPYYNTVLDNINETLGNSPDLRHVLLEKRDIKTVLYIVVSADRGLAGGYNAGVIRKAEKEIRTRDAEHRIITIGTKARDYFTKRNYNVADSSWGIVENPEYNDAKKIGNKAVAMYLSGEIDEINLIYMKFVSTLSQEPSILKLLPSTEVKGKEGRNRYITEFEPDADEVLSYLIPKYIQITIYGGLIEASASEQAARRVAMESATDNAEEMIDELQISYNRARQASITREISEIVSGAEALK